MPHAMADFHVTDHMMRYSQFVPRLYNLCKSLGFEAGRIMPSRAFCSDESQGYPIILIAKHFGTFPFNHGMVGGIVATDRHGPHAHHGKDLVIIQASHVGYDPEKQEWGTYRRLQTDQASLTSSCGKICGILDWYSEEYQFARDNIYFTRLDGTPIIVIDNLLLDSDRGKGIFLRLEKMIIADEVGGQIQPLRVYSTAKGYRIHSQLLHQINGSELKEGERTPIGEILTAGLFYFRQQIQDEGEEGRSHLEQNLSFAMPEILTAESPALAAALANTQVEFDRAYRTLLKEPEYQDRNLLFIAGINIDISPQPGQLFPLTKFVPWAAFVQNQNGERFTMEQDELLQRLLEQSTENPDKIDLEEAIAAMEQAEEVKVRL
ncbi:MAG: hypothetical protein IZT60_05530 [Gammaproteobacteria bacterium]|nr:hypothetical protein [Gammaproteobacteria bacterium]